VHCFDANPLGFEGAASELFSHLPREVGHAKSKCAAVHIGTQKLFATFYCAAIQIDT
jgi:hypothetical protein